MSGEAILSTMAAQSRATLFCLHMYDGNQSPSHIFPVASVMTEEALVLFVVARMLYPLDTKHQLRIFRLQVTNNVVVFRSPLLQLDHKKSGTTSQHLAY